MIISAELQAKIAQWRLKAIEGTLTREEMAEAVTLLRGDRVAAAKSTDSARRTKAIKVIPSAADLLDEIGDL